MARAEPDDENGGSMMRIPPESLLAGDVASGLMHPAIKIVMDSKIDIDLAAVCFIQTIGTLLLCFLAVILSPHLLR